MLRASWMFSPLNIPIANSVLTMFGVSKRAVNILRKSGVFDFILEHHV